MNKASALKATIATITAKDKQGYAATNDKFVYSDDLLCDRWAGDHKHLKLDESCDEREGLILAVEDALAG